MHLDFLLYFAYCVWTCGVVAQSQQILSNESGKIHSPGYPESYEENLDVSWKITTKPGYKIILNFTAFNIEDSHDEDEGDCAYDFVEVVDREKVIYKFCGNSEIRDWNAPKLNKGIESTSHELTLRFVSDYSNEDPKPKGFEANYRTADRDECQEKRLEVLLAYEDWDEIIYCNHKCHNVPGSYSCSCEPGFHLHANKHTCTSTCEDLILTEDEGIITTSRYPKPYSKLADCRWIIKGKKGIAIDIRFIDTFSIEEHYEEGCVYDWMEYELADGTVSERFCGDTTPNEGKWINTRSREVKLIFRSDLTEEESGFKVQYRFNRVECKDLPVAPEHGSIRSPSTSYVFEDVVKFDCQKSFRLVGSKSVTCLSDGQWDAAPPKCEAIVCDSPKHIVNIENAAPTSIPRSLAYGATVTVSCNGEYFEMTSGAASWRCGDDAKWVPHSNLIATNTNNNIPECKPACGLKGNARRLGFQRFRRSASGLAPNVAVNRIEFKPPISVAIVRGKPAKYGEWPWMAFIDLFGLGLSSNEFCGGSLVSTRTVITAAHCTRRTFKNAIKVYMAASDRFDPGDSFIQKFDVSELYEHPNFTDDSFDADIAVLVLNRPVIIGKYVRPACLPRSQREQALPDYAISDPENFHKTGIIAGWGVTEKGYAAADLNMARVPPIKQNKCKKLFEANKPESHKTMKITKNMLCAGSPGEGNGRDSCQGDSGGPLMFKDPAQNKYFLNGIVSFGSTAECGDGTFGIYTRVSRFISWIDNFVRD